MGLLQAVREAGGRALHFSVDVVLPRTCAGCDLSGAWMCAACDTGLARINQQTACQRCGHPAADGPRSCPRCNGWPEQLAAVRAAFEFQGAVRIAIHRVKYRGEYARAEWCAAEMASLLRTLPEVPDAISAVPLARKRRRARGFNQSEVVGRALAAQTGYPYVDALERARETAPQVKLSAAERQANVVGAFRAPAPLNGARIVLIDDVLTTGATMRACATAAHQAGAGTVMGLVLATDVWGAAI